MNESLASLLPTAIPGAAFVLQGAAMGALVASSVLLRAYRRRLRVVTWAVTAAWSLLGATLALVAMVLRLLL